MVEIGFQQLEITTFEGDAFVDIIFGIINNVRISGSSDAVEVQLHTADGTATGK